MAAATEPILSHSTHLLLGAIVCPLCCRGGAFHKAHRPASSLRAHAGRKRRLQLRAVQGEPGHKRVRAEGEQGRRYDAQADRGNSVRHPLHVVVAVAAAARAARGHTAEGNDVRVAVVNVQALVRGRIEEVALGRLVCD